MLREIMKAAWADYRTRRLGVFALGDETGERHFIRSIFATSLTKAWADAKKQAVETKRRAAAQEISRQLVERMHASRVAHFAALSPAQRSERLAGLNDELGLLDYAPWGVRTIDRRSALNAELAAVTEAMEAAAPARQAA